MPGIDQHTVLLLHADGENNSINFFDSSPSGHTVNRIGSPVISTAQSKFGGSSFYSPSVGNYLSIPDSDDFAFGDLDFTIDFWIRFASAWSGNPVLIDQGWAGGGNNCILCYKADESLDWWLVIPNVSFNQSATYNLNQWYHTAVERHGNNWNFYKDGVLTQQKTSTQTMPNISSPFKIGGQTQGSVSTYWDEIRISKGIARYQSSSFTPQTEPYSAPVITGPLPLFRPS